MNRDNRAANYLLFLFGGIALLFLCLPMTGKVRGFRACAAYLFEPFPYYGSQGLHKLSTLSPDISRLIEADMRVRSLEEELRQTELLRTELESLRRENARLAQNLSLSTSAPSAVGWARVLERDPANWHRSVMIDAGEAEGVELNAPVLARHVGRMAVIGRIVETLEHSSKVLLLTDDLSAVAAYLPGSGWEGLIQGQGSARLRMNYLPVDEPLHAGDEVATSPTSATFPPDLVIGTVSKVFDRDPFLAFQTVEVAMAVPSGRIKEVLILHKRRRGNP